MTNPDPSERKLDRARMHDHIDVLGTEPFRHKRPEAEEKGVAGGEHTDRVLFGELHDAVEHRSEPGLDDDPLSAKLRKERQVSLASDEHLGTRNCVDCAAGEAGASVLANANNGDRGPHVE